MWIPGSRAFARARNDKQGTTWLTRRCLVLARLFCALIKTPTDHFHAAIRIANELVSRDHPDIDRAQMVLVEGVAKAFANTEPTAGFQTRSILVEQVFPLLRAQARARVAGTELRV